MRPIFLNDGVDELLGGGSAAQQAYAALKLGHERHGVPDQVPPLDGCVPHLPTCKFPVKDMGTFKNNTTQKAIFRQARRAGNNVISFFTARSLKALPGTSDSELN